MLPPLMRWPWQHVYWFVYFSYCCFKTCRSLYFLPVRVASRKDPALQAPARSLLRTRKPTRRFAFGHILPADVFFVSTYCFTQWCLRLFPTRQQLHGGTVKIHNPDALKSLYDLGLDDINTDEAPATDITRLYWSWPATTLCSTRFILIHAHPRSFTYLLQRDIGCDTQTMHLLLFYLDRRGKCTKGKINLGVGDSRLSSAAV